MKDLMEMLSTRRPAGSTTEKNFIRQWIKPLPGIEQDDAGNLYCRIGTEPILWSCHTDTVHNKEGFQVPSLDNGWISLAPFQQHVNCLGADDTAGVWLMVNMIRDRRPGLYIFHRAAASARTSSASTGRTPWRGSSMPSHSTALAPTRSSLTSSAAAARTSSPTAWPRPCPLSTSMPTPAACSPTRRTMPTSSPNAPT